MRGATRAAIAVAILLASEVPTTRSDREGDEEGRPRRFGGVGAWPPAPLVANGRPVSTAVPFSPSRRPDRAGPDVLVNDPALDRVMPFPSLSTPPFYFTNQSESSLAVHGSSVVVTYNTSSGTELALDASGKLVVPNGLQVGFSVSSDGGRTFRSGFLPKVSGVGTYLDNAVDVDRDGRFYAAYASDTNDTGAYGIVVSRSDDGGSTWGTPAVASGAETGLDKLWIAVGPDPVLHGQDNVYVAWTSIASGVYKIHLSRSRDSGRTFSSPTTVFSPTATNGFKRIAQAPTPFVDAVDGRLYVAFVQQTSQSAWWPRLAVSDDAGSTFSLVRFGFPGTPVPDAIPAVPAGHYSNCGAGEDNRWVVHAGPDNRPAGSTLPRHAQSWWTFFQPFVAAHGDLVALTWGSSTSPDPFDSASNSRVFLTVSRDRGITWSTPLVVDSELPGDGQHFQPALAVDAATRDIHVSYYVQHADETIDTELSTMREADGYTTIHVTRLTSKPSTIPPSLEYLGAGTWNYDIISLPCYSMGHYMQLRADAGTAYATWTDARNLITHAVDARDPLSGQTHSQPDVYFRAVRP